MAMAEVTGGDTGTVTLDTPVTLTTQTTAGTYVLGVDFTNHAATDITELTIKVKLRSASSSKIAYQRTFSGIQSEIIRFSIPVPVPFEIICTLEQTDGAAKSFEWSLYRA
jgi:hypothetical protein